MNYFLQTLGNHCIIIPSGYKYVIISLVSYEGTGYQTLLNRTQINSCTNASIILNNTTHYVASWDMANRLVIAKITDSTQDSIFYTGYNGVKPDSVLVQGIR